MSAKPRWTTTGAPYWTATHRWDVHVNGGAVRADVAVWGTTGGYWWEVATCRRADGVAMRNLDGRATTPAAARRAALAAADELIAHGLAALGGA